MVVAMNRLSRIPGGLPVLTFIGLLLVWEISVLALQVPSFLLPSPSRIAAGFEPVPALRWMEHVWATLRVAMIGFVTAIVVSIPLAIGLTRSRVLSAGLYPLLVVIQSTPIVAIAPIIIVTMGSGDP